MSFWPRFWRHFSNRLLPDKCQFSGGDSLEKCGLLLLAASAAVQPNGDRPWLSAADDDAVRVEQGESGESVCVIPPIVFKMILRRISDNMTPDDMTNVYETVLKVTFLRKK